MPIKDIIEPEAPGVSVPLDPVPAKPTSQQQQRTRGEFVKGRYVPSKQVKVAHRRSKSPLSLKEWAKVKARAAAPDAAAVDWLRNKGLIDEPTR